MTGEYPTKNLSSISGTTGRRVLEYSCPDARAVREIMASLPAVAMTQNDDEGTIGIAKPGEIEIYPRFLTVAPDGTVRFKWYDDCGSVSVLLTGELRAAILADRVVQNVAHANAGWEECQTGEADFTCERPASKILHLAGPSDGTSAGDYGPPHWFASGELLFWWRINEPGIEPAFLEAIAL